MEIRKSASLSGEIKIGDVVVATLNGNSSNQGLNYNVSVNILKKDVIDSTAENKAFYESEKKAFEDALINASVN